jgi:hypothetical protein
MNDIYHTLCDYFGLTITDLKSRKRKPARVKHQARKHLYRQGLSYNEIADIEYYLIGIRYNHSTILHSVNNTPHDEELALIGTVKPSDRAIQEIEKALESVYDYITWQWEEERFNDTIVALQNAIDYLK